MFDLDRWGEVWATISRNKMRSFLTAMGIFWGIFMLVILSGAGLFLERMLSSQVGSFATNSAFFYPNITSKAHKGFNIGRWWSFENSDKDMIREQIKGVKYVSGIIYAGQNNLVVGNKQGKYNTTAHEPQYGHIEPQVMLYGRYINEIDATQKRKVCMIGQQIYEDLFTPGVDPTGLKIKLFDSYFTIIGVHTPSSSGININGNARATVIVPFSTMQQMLNRGEKFDMFAVVGENDADVSLIEKEIKTLLRNRHNISPDDLKAVGSFNIKEEFDVFQSLFLGLNILIWIVGLGTLTAGVVGVSNIMLVLVKERTQEIGVRRALGAKPFAIISQIMSESFVLTFVAGVMGLGFGVGVLAIADKILNAQLMAGQTPISPQLSFGVAMLATSVLIIGGMIAGIIPAERAMSIKPVDAIREE